MHNPTECPMILVKRRRASFEPKIVEETIAIENNEVRPGSPADAQFVTVEARFARVSR
jgi:hypothetical protein